MQPSAQASRSRLPKPTDLHRTLVRFSRPISHAVLPPNNKSLVAQALMPAAGTCLYAVMPPFRALTV